VVITPVSQHLMNFLLFLAYAVMQAGMGPEDVVLYFGVIDFLQVYTSEKAYIPDHAQPDQLH
jgi:hypothetical protein